MLTLTLPPSRCQMPCMRSPHCKPKAASSRLTPTLLNPYFLRNVMRKPKPMKIITWTSWNTGHTRGEVTSADTRGLEIQSDEDLIKRSLTWGIWHRSRSFFLFCSNDFWTSQETFSSTRVALSWLANCKSNLIPPWMTFWEKKPNLVCCLFVKLSSCDLNKFKLIKPQRKRLIWRLLSVAAPKKTTGLRADMDHISCLLSPIAMKGGWLGCLSVC